MQGDKWLIDANELRQRIESRIYWGQVNNAACLEAIDDAPTVDAVEVVHGHWIPRIDNDTPMHECSVCGARVVKQFYECENPNLFCYHCGAKMDGERRDND